VLFFIHIPTRQVFFAGTTTNPTGAWTTQAARNLFLLHHTTPLAGSRALVRDRGSQFIDKFDEIFRTEGLKILKTPVRTPVANSYAERWIGSIRRELLKQPKGLPRTIIWNQHQLERLVVDYIDHYNDHRPHRSLDQRPPLATETPPPPAQHHLQVVKSAHCDGLINEYRNAA
ncbi:MAG: transposase, partial [Actinomycetia bacterium]|nr:transposase [Actinomycetes bacterium]